MSANWTNKRRVCGNILISIFLLISGCDTLAELEKELNNRATLVVKNQSYESILYLYQSDCERDNWSGDQLGNTIIDRGGEHRLDISPGCYNFRIEMESGRLRTRWGMALDPGDTKWWTVR